MHPKINDMSYNFKNCYQKIDKGKLRRMSLLTVIAWSPTIKIIISVATS